MQMIPLQPPPTELMKSVLESLGAVELGVAQFNLIMPHDGSTGGPRFSTRKYNPREATKLSLKKLEEWFDKTSGGLLKDRVEHAIYMGVKAEWIENLDEIRNYRPDSGQPLPRVKWSPEAKDGIAELLNGNHRYKLLQEQVAEQEKQLREVRGRMKKFKEMDEASRNRKQQQETDERLEKQLKAILKKEGLFAVKLFDLGE
jgi:hypothetical protein